MALIYRFVALISLFFHGLVVWADDLSLKTSNSTTEYNSIPPISAILSTSNKNSNSKTITLNNVPVNNVPTPIIITINSAPSAPVAQMTPVAPTTPPSGQTPTKVKIAPPSIGNKVEIPPTPSLDIVIRKKYINSPKVRKLYKMLGIAGSPRVIHLVTDPTIEMANRKDNIIGIQLRSFVSVLAYLSNAVEVLPEMLKQKLVISPQYPDGTYYDLNQVTKGLLAIHISKERPRQNVSVQVYYRNHWFYIADNDYKSKRTFSMIEQLFNLQAGETAGQNSPILTLPVR